MKDLCSSLIGFKQINYFAKKIFETREEADSSRCQFKFKKTIVPDVRRKLNFYL